MDGSSEKSKEDELLVFGYACKLFRDDEKALFIDSGKHLIPWMADESLKIDRYDGRGALSDLRPHEPPTGGFDRWHGLTDRERKLEEVVDQERYMALYKDEDEERMLEEEEWKRLQTLASDKGRYNQIGFSYDAAPVPGGGGTQEPVPAGDGAAPADDEPYEPPAALNVPADMAQPATPRHADIIERTAHFVARQGPQMEILIKAKQSENAMFDFLAFDDPLQPFFRHMVVMIKAGRYTIGPQKQEEEDEAYLHPALNLSRPDIAPGKTDVMYQPSANCAYQRLVKNIRSSRQAADSPAGSGTSSPVPTAAAAASSPAAAPAAAPAPAPAAVPSPTPAAAGSAAVDTPNTTAAAKSTEATATGAPATSRAPTAAALPPADVKLIIDKMASYVAKNGRDFEGIVMGRGDERFSFLKDSHRHHAYYRQKLEQYERDLGKTKPAATAAAPAAAETAEDKANKPVPVSFSIRPKSEKEAAPLERSALPLEESEDEDEEGAQTATAAGTEANGDTRQQKAAAVVASAPAVPSREPAKKQQSRQVPIVAPAPGVGRDEIQLDRKRRAAQFLAKLRQDVDKIKQPVIGPQLPPGPLPTGSGSDAGSDVGSDSAPESRSAPSPAAGPSPPPPQPQQPQPPQQEEEEEDSGDDADLDKYKLVDSDSPHSVPELASDSDSAAEARSDGQLSDSAGDQRDSSDRRRSRDDSVSKRSSRDASVSKRSSRDASVSKRSSRDASVSKRSSRDASVSKRSSRGASVSKRSSRDASVSKRSSRGASERRSSRGASVSKRSSRGASERRNSRGASVSKRSSRGASERRGSRDGSGRRASVGREEREERRRRHRHKKRSSHHHRRRRHRRQHGSDNEAARSLSRSPVRSRSRSPRRHKKRRKRPRSPPASYKRLQSPGAAPLVEQHHWPRSSRSDRSRSPVRGKRRRSHSSKRHKHKSKKSKRSKRSGSRSRSRSARAPEVTEVTLSPGLQPDPAAAPGDVIDLTGADSPERRLSQSDSGGGGGTSPPGRPDPDLAAAADSRASTPRGASPTPVPSAGWSPSDSGSRSHSGSAASSRSGSPLSRGRPSDSEPERDGPRALNTRDEEARRTDEAIAQLKRKLVRRSTPTTNGGAVAAAVAARPAPAADQTPAERSSSALVAQMAEGLKAKVHEMMKGSLLGK